MNKKENLFSGKRGKTKKILKDEKKIFARVFYEK